MQLFLAGQTDVVRLKLGCSLNEGPLPTGKSLTVLPLELDEILDISPIMCYLTAVQIS
ncbi:hypothetical protein LguiB_010983 [Lonicera macranthoides]